MRVSDTILPQAQLKRWVNSVTNRYSAHYTPKAGLQGNPVCLLIALLIIPACLIALWGLSGPIEPHSPSLNDRPWRNSPVFNPSTVFDENAAGHVERGPGEILSDFLVAVGLVLAVGCLVVLVIAPGGRTQPAIGRTQPACRRRPVVGSRSLGFIDECSYQFSDSGMVITRPFPGLHIAYDCVSRIVRKPGSDPRKTGQVRVTFKRFGRARVLTFRPECPEVFVAELMAYCPQLTSSKYHRKKRGSMLRGERLMTASSTSKLPRN